MLDVQDEERSLFGNGHGPSFVRKHKKRLIIGAAVGALVLLIIMIIAIAASRGSSSSPRNIIFFITDGMGPASVTMARVCAGGPSLLVDNYLVGSSQTYSSNSWVTDSAAGATAYACALKSYNKAIAVDPARVPCGTLLEAAKKKKMKTGMVVTSRVTHATPASFSSHSVDRDKEYFIAQQQVDSMVSDLMFGGGLDNFERRPDRVNLTAKAVEKGYNFIKTFQEFSSDKLKLPLIGLFAPEHMDFEIDRNPSQQPSLADMTRKALDLLSKNNDHGFFLLVEASRIDMAGHNNDPSCQIHDTLMFNSAFEVALEFAKKHTHTLIVSTSDHETGGLSLGSNYHNNSYPEYEWDPSVLNAVTMSAEKMADVIISQGQGVRQTLLTYAKIALTADEETLIQDAVNKYAFSRRDVVITTIGNVISYRARIGWSSYGHSGVDVNLYAYGYQSEGLQHSMNNIAVGSYVAEKFDLNLAEVTKELANFNPVPPNFVESLEEETPRFHG